MKNKKYYITKLISISFIAIFLLSIFVKKPYFLNRIIMLPFLLCSFTEISKIISLMMNKTKQFKIFNTIYIVSFLIYWFAFLAYWCYTSYIGKNYLLLILSIPFWMIGIYVVHKYLNKKQ